MAPSARVGGQSAWKRRSLAESTWEGERRGGESRYVGSGVNPTLHTLVNSKWMEKGGNDIESINQNWASGASASATSRSQA